MNKIGFFIIVIATGILLLIKCSDNQSVNSEKEKTFDDFKRTLPHDALFGNILASAKKLDDYVADDKTKINTDLDIERFKRRLTKVKKRDTQMSILSNLTNRPEEYYAIVKNKYKQQQKFISENPGFLKLSEAEQKELISYVVNKKMFNIKSSSYNVDTFSTNAGPCEDQHKIDDNACKHQAYAAAAGCGLLAETIFGALGCGAGVLVADGICHHHAQKSYENCKKHENDDSQ